MDTSLEEDLGAKVVPEPGNEALVEKQRTELPSAKPRFGETRREFVHARRL